MEILGAYILDKCDDNLWDPISASRGGVAFSQLFFADDLVLFTKADVKNCRAIRDVLDTFCDLSEQKVSAKKSRVFFSPNLAQHHREELYNILNFQSTPSLGKYLGFPIKHNSIPQDFWVVVERIQNRLAGWKTHLLSFAGRFVLTQTTLSTILNYSMQCAALPSKITQSLDRLCRNFIWGTTDSKRKLHLVSWKKITKPKKEGGFGLQSAKERNSALLAKLNWRFHQEKDSLWARVLSHKFLTRRR